MKHSLLIDDPTLESQTIPWERPALVFAPLAWLKLQFFLHAGDSEIGGFGIAADPQRPLHVSEFVTVQQRVSAVSVELADAAVADHFDACADQGLSPAQCGRLWIHTHPGDCPRPSGTDEATFARVFGGCDWAVMGILARGGRSYARLALNVGPGSQVRIPMRIDWSAWPQAAMELGPQWPDLIEAWQAEFQAHVHPIALGGRHVPVAGDDAAAYLRSWFDDPFHGFDDAVPCWPQGFARGGKEQP